MEPTVGEKLCRLWQSVEGDDGVLTGSRSGGPRGDSRHSASSGHGSSSMGGSSGPGPFPAAKGHPHHMYPAPPMYFPYHHSMHQSVYPGSGDSRNQMAMSAFFSQPPRLGYSSPTHHNILPPPLHPSMGGGGGGAYSRPGRPWWTVPPFPPPSHLHHHPHQPHGHPPFVGSDFYEQNSVQDENPASMTAAAEEQPPPSGEESPVAPPKTVVPRTSSRNAYSQQRQSILKKQQQQALKASKKEDANGRRTYTRDFLFSEDGDSSKVSVLVKNMRMTDGTHSIPNDEKSEQRGIKSKDDTNFDAKKGAN